MEPRVTIPSGPPPRQISFPIGALAAAFAVILAVALAWHWTHRQQDVSWNTTAITARFADVSSQQDGRNVHVLLRYHLTNNTGKIWRMPPPTHGALMSRLPDGDLHEMDSVQWEPSAIAAGKTAEATFDLLIDSTREDMPVGFLRQPQNLSAFVNRHLSRIQRLAFLDYSVHNRIDLPTGWDTQHPSPPPTPE